MYDRGLPENRVLLQRHGGWRTASYDVFYVNGDRQWEPLPTFHFEKCHSAIFQNAISRLSAEEQILALCLEFEYGITDDLEEVLASENLFDIIEALQTVGAKQYADFLRHILRHDFRDVRFPLDDEQIASRPLQRRIEKTHKAIWNDKVAHDEFHKAVVLYLLTKFSNADTIF